MVHDYYGPLDKRVTDSSDGKTRTFAHLEHGQEVKRQIDMATGKTLFKSELPYNPYSAEHVGRLPIKKLKNINDSVMEDYVFHKR